MPTDVHMPLLAELPVVNVLNAALVTSRPSYSNDNFLTVSCILLQVVPDTHISPVIKLAHCGWWQNHRI